MKSDSPQVSGGSPRVSPRVELPPAAPAQPAVSTLRRVLGVVLLLFLMAVAALVWWQQDYLRDWAQLRSYEPSNAIEVLSTETTMTPYAQRLFYVNKPAVEERESFNEHCSDLAESEAAVLGCFRGDRLGIYIYNITDERLAGIQHVTAAHEMLHQAYVRLGGKERERINAQLTAYAKTVADERIKEKIALYQRTEPHDVENEMHSIFGTEVAELPKELEEYYSRYFTNRQAVVVLNQHYRAAFDERTAKIAAYDAQLIALRAQIDAQRTVLDTKENELRALRAQLDDYLAKDQISAYNAAVPPYNKQVVAYKQLVTAVNAIIAEYNKLIDERNALTVEQQELLQAQDSQAP